MLLREILPGIASDESNKMKKYYKLLDKKIIRTFNKNNSRLFHHKHIISYYEIEGGFYVGFNVVNSHTFSFPVVKKLNLFPRLEKLYVFKDGDKERMAQFYNMTETQLILIDINTSEKIKLETSKVIEMRKNNTFRDATTSDQALYLLCRNNE